MGINYYYVTKKCKECGHSPDEATHHIGKFNYNNVFIFCGRDPTRTSWKEWRDWLKSGEGVIYDEYDEEIPFEEFELLVTGSLGNTYSFYEKSLKNTNILGDTKIWEDEEGYPFWNTWFS